MEDIKPGIKSAIRKSNLDINGNPIEGWTCIWVTYKDDKRFCVPLDERSQKYKEYLEWVAEGGVPVDE